MLTFMRALERATLSGMPSLLLTDILVTRVFQAYTTSWESSCELSTE